MRDLGSRSFRRRVLWVLLAASVIMVLPALDGDILNYDDRELLLGEGRALERSPWSFFGETFYYAYTPFYGLSYWIDGLVAGDNPRVFHLGNVLWHAATGYLVFCVLGLLLRNRVGALLGALLFVVHPLHVESVAWISGRKEVLSGFFFFLAWLLHLGSERRRGLVWWALLVFLAACFTKASAVVLPGLLLAAALFLPRYAERRRVAALATLPFFLAALVPVVVHLAIGVHHGIVREVADTGTRVLSGIAAWGWSVWNTLVPLDLSIDYPEARVESVAGVALPLIFLAAAAAAAIAMRRRAPVVTFGIAAFFVALAPFNDVFPATTVFMADRYLYLPLFGAAAVAAWAVGAWRNGPAVAALVAVAYVGLSIWGATRFLSDEVLWTRTIESRDGSAVAYFNRGAARYLRGREATPVDRALIEQARTDLEAALPRATLDEHRLKAHAALVEPLLMLGEVEEALERANAALAQIDGIETREAEGFRAKLLFTRGGVQVARANYRRAAADYVEAARLRPSYAYCLEAGKTILAAGSPEVARPMLERAARLDAGRAEPLLLLAKVHRVTGNQEAFRRALQDAARREPRSPGVVEGWVEYWLYARTPDYRKARKELDRLPASSPARTKLEAKVEAQSALYHFRRGDMEPALEAADRARELGLGRSGSLYDLGQIYMDARRYDEAIDCFRASADVLAARPVHRDAVARAYALKAYGLLSANDRPGARRAMRAALEARPVLIEAGAAPLRGELALLERTREENLLLLAAAAVAGDPAHANTLARDLLASDLTEQDRALAYRLRALVRAFVTYDFEGAEADLNQVLAREPGDRWTRFRMAQVWILSGAGWLRTADQLSSVERREQGRGLLARGIALLDRLLEEEPGFHQARLQRGEAHFALEDLVRAKADYLHVREHAPELKEACVKEAVLHRLVYVQGGDRANLDSAADILGQALSIDPNYFDALYELGNIHHLLYDRQSDPTGDRKAAFHRAVLWYRRAMALNPRSRDARLEWARICLKAGQEAEAGGSVRAAHDLLGRVEAEAGDIADLHKRRIRLNMRPDFVEKTGLKPDAVFEQAARALEAIERLVPEDPELPELQALYHRRQGYAFYWTWVKLSEPRRKERARELAVEAWGRALEAWPEDPDNASVRQRLREIAPEFIDLDRKRAQAAFERGAEAMRDSRYGDAARAFGEAVLLFPEALELRYNYALALARAGERDRAREQLERVANHPEGGAYPGAAFELGNLYLVKGKRMIAKAWYRRYVEAMDRAGRGEEPTVRRARQILEELG